jgi:RimJ/RimL family protein N-acetyltransferase
MDGCSLTRDHESVAVKDVLTYGFTQRRLHRISAPHFLDIPASCLVLEKAGMPYDSRIHEHYLRFDQYAEVEDDGLLTQDFDRY